MMENKRSGWYPRKSGKLCHWDDEKKAWGDKEFDTIEEVREYVKTLDGGDPDEPSRKRKVVFALAVLSVIILLGVVIYYTLGVFGSMKSTSNIAEPTSTSKTTKTTDPSKSSQSEVQKDLSDKADQAAKDGDMGSSDYYKSLASKSTQAQSTSTDDKYTQSLNKIMGYLNSGDCKGLQSAYGINDSVVDCTNNQSMLDNIKQSGVKAGIDSRGTDNSGKVTFTGQWNTSLGGYSIILNSDSSINSIVLTPSTDGLSVGQ